MAARDPNDWTHNDLVYMRKLVEVIRERVCDGEFIIYRGPFRWRQDDGGEGVVLPNHYDSYSLEQIADDNGYDIVEDYNRVAIVRLAGMANA